MKKRVGIVPWLFSAMVMLFGAHAVAAAELGAVAGTGTASSGTLTAPTISIDKTELNNGGVIKVSGQAPAGKPVFLEVWSADHSVRANRFDSEIDKESGKRPYVFYITSEMPSYYKTFVAKELQPKIDAAKKEGKKWSYSALLKDLGADIAYSVPVNLDGQCYRQSGYRARGHG